LSTASVRVACWGGRWRVILRTGPGSNGRAIETCPDEAAARRRAELVAQQVQAGALTCSEPPRTIATLLDTAISERHNIVPASAEAYRTRAIRLKAALGEVQPKALTRQAISRYIETRLRAPTTGNVVRSEIALLSSACRLAVERGWLQMPLRDVFGRHRYPDAPAVEWLRADELRRFLQALDAEPDWIRFACLLAARAGLRVDEATHVRWMDLDTTRRTLEIRAYGTWKPKGGHNRTVPVSKSLLGALGEALDPPAPIVPDANPARRPTRNQLLTATARVCKAADIRRVTFHALRHTFASLYLESGGSLVECSRILGHKSCDFTAKMYIHVSTARMVSSVDRMDAMLDSPATAHATATREPTERPAIVAKTA